MYLYYSNEKIVKYYINNLIEKNKKLPETFNPVCIKINNLSEYKWIHNDLVYDIFLLLIYTNLIKNQVKEINPNPLENGEMYNFLYKSFLSVIVFSLIKKQIEENKFVKQSFLNEIKRRYENYKEKNIFKEYEDTIPRNTKSDFNITSQNIIISSTKILEAFINNHDKFELNTITTIFKPILSLNKEKIKELEIENIEQIKNILTLESLLKENKKEEIKNLELSEKIKNYYLPPIKIKLDNLKRFLLEQKVNQEILNCILQNIHTDFRNLKNINIDFNLLSTEALKSICIWENVLNDTKLMTNYNYFITKIKDSKLSRNLCLSLLHNIIRSEKEESLTQFIKLI